MAFCIFDNPSTMRREFWRDGKCIVSYAFDLFFIKNPPKWVDKSMPWKEGRVAGDIEAFHKPKTEETP